MASCGFVGLEFTGTRKVHASTARKDRNHYAYGRGSMRKERVSANGSYCGECPGRRY